MLRCFYYGTSLKLIKTVITSHILQIITLPEIITLHQVITSPQITYCIMHQFVNVFV